MSDAAETSVDAQAPNWWSCAKIVWPLKHVFTINLRQRVDRHDAMLAQLRVAQIEVLHEFVPGVDGADLNADVLAPRTIKAGVIHSFNVAGCYLAWEGALRRALSVAQFPALICEDDAQLGSPNGLAPPGTIPPDADLISLGSVDTHKQCADHRRRGWIVRAGGICGQGSVALLIPTSDAAKKILGYLEARDILDHVDNVLLQDFPNHGGNVYFADPPPLTWGASFSDVAKKWRAARIEVNIHMTPVSQIQGMDPKPNRFTEKAQQLLLLWQMGKQDGTWLSIAEKNTGQLYPEWNERLTLYLSFLKKRATGGQPHCQMEICQMWVSHLVHTQNFEELLQQPMNTYSMPEDGISGLVQSTFSERSSDGGNCSGALRLSKPTPTPPTLTHLTDLLTSEKLSSDAGFFKKLLRWFADIPGLAGLCHPYVWHRASPVLLQFLAVCAQQYETYLTSGLDLAPTICIDWLWRVHLCEPLLYAQACCRHFNNVRPHISFEYDMDSARAWKAIYGESMDEPLFRFAREHAEEVSALVISKSRDALQDILATYFDITDREKTDHVLSECGDNLPLSLRHLIPTSVNLLVFDLNGILLLRSREESVKNPLADDFICSCAEMGFEYAFWSAGPPDIVARELHLCFPGLCPLFAWNQEHCLKEGMSEEVEGKPRFIKPMDSITKAFPHFQNILFIEHSPEKLRDIPHGCAIVVPSWRESVERGSGPNPLDADGILATLLPKLQGAPSTADIVLSEHQLPAQSPGPPAKSPSLAAKSSSPAANSSHPAAKSSSPAANSSDPAAKSSSPANTSSPMAKSSGPNKSSERRRSSGSGAKSPSLAVKSPSPVAKSSSPAAKRSGPAAKSSGPAAKSSGPAANTSASSESTEDVREHLTSETVNVTLTSLSGEVFQHMERVPRSFTWLDLKVQLWRDNLSERNAITFLKDSTKMEDLDVIGNSDDSALSLTIMLGEPLVPKTTLKVSPGMMAGPPRCDACNRICEQMAERGSPKHPSYSCGCTAPCRYCRRPTNKRKLIFPPRGSNLSFWCGCGCAECKFPTGQCKCAPLRWDSDVSICFTERCLFRSSRGLVPITELALGDEVSTGQLDEFGQEIFLPVARIWVRSTPNGKEVMKLSEDCELTSEHPIFVNGRWCRCFDLSLPRLWRTDITEIYNLELEGHIDTVAVGGVLCAAIGAYCDAWNVFTRKTVRCMGPCGICDVVYEPCLDFSSVTEEMLERRCLAPESGALPPLRVMPGLW